MNAGVKMGLWLVAVLGVAWVGMRITHGAQKPDYKLVIYDDEHLRGKNIIIREKIADLGPEKFNSKSESLEWNAMPGRAFVCFDDKNFQKPILVLIGKGEVQDLGKEQRNALHSITSVMIMQCPKGKFPKGTKDVPKLGTEE